MKKPELEATIARTEHTINCRPITSSSDPPLRPMDFLTPVGGDMTVPEGQLPPQGDVLLDDLAAKQKSALAQFWAKWHHECLVNLPKIVSKHFLTKNVNINDMVLVNDNISYQKRLTWPLGKIVKLYPGRDGLVRSVDIKMKNGTFNRSIQRLHKLELMKHDEFAPYETLSGRIVKNRIN